MSRTFGTTTPTPVTGTLSVPSLAVLDSETMITSQADVTHHLAGNPAGMAFTVDISLDGGNTWDFLMGWNRPQGANLLLDKQGNPINFAFCATNLPAGTGRKLRGSLVITPGTDGQGAVVDTVTTDGQIVLS